MVTRLASTTCARRACGASSTRARGCRSRCSPTRRPTPAGRGRATRCRSRCWCCSRACRRSSARVFLLHEVFDYRLRRDRRDRRQERGQLPPDRRPGAPRTSTSGGRASSPPRAARGARAPLLRRAVGGRDRAAGRSCCAEDVAFYGDGGGKAPRAHGRRTGAIAWPERWPASAGWGRDAAGSRRVAEFNGQPGVLAFDADGTLVAAWELQISGGAIQAIYGVVNPDKLDSHLEHDLAELAADLKALVGGCHIVERVASRRTTPTGRRTRSPAARTARRRASSSPSPPASGRASRCRTAARACTSTREGRDRSARRRRSRRRRSAPAARAPRSWPGSAVRRRARG